MTRSPLDHRLSAAGATFGEYCGVETARNFGDPNREYQALISGCAVYDLSWRAKIVLAGNDRVRWTNGMVTNNIRDLQPAHGNYNFLLSSQGRIQADLYVYNLGDHLLVDTERWQAENIKTLFDKYIIMDDVEVSDVSDKLTSVAVQGPKSLSVLRALGLTIADDVEPLTVEQMGWKSSHGSEVGISVTRMASDIAQTYEIWLATENVATLWDALVAAGATPVGTDALEMFRIVAGVPRFGQDIRDRDLPQETDQQHALHFAKGCYLGQEIVERIRSRGAVHRHLTGFVVEGDAPAAGTKVRAGDKEAGEITSALRVPAKTGERTLALGYIRDETARPGSTVQVNGSQAKVVKPPFKDLIAS